MTKALTILSLAMAAMASASPLYTTTATLTGVNGASIGGYYTGPYYLTVGNEHYEAFCDDFDDHVSIGETWAVDVYSGADSDGAYFAPAQYDQIFALVDLAFEPGADHVSIQQAIWRVTDPGYTSGPDVSVGTALVDPGRFIIISGRGIPGSRPQEFVAIRQLQNLSDSSPVPEPATLGIGLAIGVALLAIRKRSAGR